MASHIDLAKYFWRFVLFVTTLIMRLTYDPKKREKTLTERGLDFARAEEVFDGIGLPKTTGVSTMVSFVA